MHDLAVITVSVSDAKWLGPCLSTLYARLGPISADVVVVDNESVDGTGSYVRAEFPQARVVESRNLGFAHGNNRALMSCDARYVLFLNPDTEILDGTFADLVRVMDERPEVGLAGCRQINGQGELDTTIRWFPNALRALGDALSAERLPRRPRWLGERELDPSAYDRELSCDWTSGSFMLVRREALESAGWMDERFFMYSEETDLCRRIKDAGWDVRHLPQMTILHHEGKAGIRPHIEALSAVNRLAYARKHFSPAHRAAYAGAVVLRHAVRAVHGGAGERGRARRAASLQVLRTLAGRAPVPFAERTSPIALQPATPEQRAATPSLDQSVS